MLLIYITGYNSYQNHIISNFESTYNSIGNEFSHSNTHHSINIFVYYRHQILILLKHLESYKEADKHVSCDCGTLRDV